MSIVNLFPTPILRTQMPNYNCEDFKRRLEPVFHQHDESVATGAELSGTGLEISTSTHGILFIHKQPELADVFDFINENIEAFWKEMKFVENPGIHYSWANKYYKGGYAKMHNHSPYLISGVFYVYQESDEMGNIYFQDPNEALLCTQPQNDERKLSQNSTVLQVRTGELILFPSYLKHGTYPNKTDIPRISIAFDVGFKGLDMFMKLQKRLNV